jgi:hypothetical protein
MLLPIYVDVSSINGKAVLNGGLLRGYGFCRSNRSAIGLRKICAKVPYKTLENLSSVILYRIPCPIDMLIYA